MKENFELALEHVLVHEGGWANHPRDPGGATMKGVTLTTFRRHYGNHMTKNDLRNISSTQLKKIYKSGYWNKCLMQPSIPDRGGARNGCKRLLVHNRMAA